MLLTLLLLFAEPRRGRVRAPVCVRAAGIPTAGVHSMNAGP